jgi:hypothetical protein
VGIRTSRLTAVTMRGKTTSRTRAGAGVGLRGAACALLLAGAVLLPQPVASAAARPTFGVDALDFPTAAGYRAVDAAGGRVVRLSIFWQKVEPTASSPPSWSSYDAAFAAAASAGIRILPLLHGSAPWVNSNFQQPPLGAAWKEEAWMHFVQEFAARYGHDGLFWKLHPTLPYLPPEYWEVWNEPNLRYFWGGRPQPGKYLTLLRITGEALRAGDPSALVSVGGLFEHARHGFGLRASDFLNRLYRRAGDANYFDAVALHPYGTKPRDVLTNVKLSRSVMRRHADGATPILVTEVGWAVRGLGLSRSPFKATLRQQAHRLTRSFDLLAARPALGVPLVLWFSLQDGPENLWIVKMGLFNRAGQPRPAWYAFARVAGGTP